MFNFSLHSIHLFSYEYYAEWQVKCATHLSNQCVEMGGNSIYIDPAVGSKIDNFAKNKKWKITKFNDIKTIDGIFDLLCFTADESGIEMAVSLILEVNPFESKMIRKKYEVPLTSALRDAFNAGFGNTTGEALNWAVANNKLDPDIAKPILIYAKNNPAFKSCIGNGNKRVSLFDKYEKGGMLLQFGDSNLDFNPNPKTISQRASNIMLKMSIYASMYALYKTNNNNGKTLWFDEGWVLTQNAVQELQNFVRMARKLKVIATMGTHIPSDIKKAKVMAYISRIFIMSIEERAEALDSLELLDVKHKVDWLERIQSSNKITDNSTLKSIPNKKSLRPLFDDKGKNIRGAVCLYSDLSKNLAFVDIDIAPELQELYFG